MDLDHVLHRAEPEPEREPRGWLIATILVLTLAATAIGGALLVLALYGAGMVARLDVWDGP